VIFRIFKGMFCGLVVALLAGCAGVGSPTDASSGQASKLSSAEKLVMLRAQQRWDELMAGELNKAYAFISPAGRAKLQAQDYRTRVNTGHFRKAVVQEASCQIDSCEVKVSLDYVVGGMALKQTLSEIWILDEGNWWFVYRG
jgi:hypothetical protein